MKPIHILVAVVIAALSFGVGVRVGTLDQPRAVYGEDAAERLRELLRHPEPNARAIGLAEFFQQANPMDAEGLLQVLRDERDHVDEVAEVLFADWWVAFAPEAAMAHKRPPPWGGRHPWVRTVVRAWARQDPEAAAAAVNDMPGDRWVGRQEGVRSLIKGWVESDQQDLTGLLQLLVNMGQVRDRGEAIDVLMQQLIAVRGVDATEQFVLNLPPQVGRITTEMHGRLVSALLREDPDRAVAFAKRHVGSEHESGLLLHMAANWGWKDGPAALEWATSLDESPFKDRVVERAGRSYLGMHTEEAMAWLEGQQPTRALEPAYALYLRQLGKQGRPQEALERLHLISDPKRRERVLTVVGRAWLEQDASAAEAWLASAKLPTAIVRKIRSPGSTGLATRAEVEDS